MEKKRNTLIGVITAIILVLIVVGIVGLVYSLTNGFNEEFKTFLVEHDGERILASDSETYLECDKEHTFDVRYIFDDPNGEAREYGVKVIANTDVDFDFTVDDKQYTWKAMGDISSAFGLVKHESSFTLTIPEDCTAQKVLETLYPGKKVDAPSDREISSLYLYTLVVSSYNGAVTYNIDFCIRGEEIEIVPDHVIF